MHELVTHLGLSDISWNNNLEQYRGYDLKVVNFVALCEWRQQKKQKMKKTSFKDLSDALTEVDYNQHVNPSCQVLQLRYISDIKGEIIYISNIKWDLIHILYRSLQYTMTQISPLLYLIYILTAGLL
jgi:hypothetical protein